MLQISFFLNKLAKVKKTPPGDGKRRPKDQTMIRNIKILMLRKINLPHSCSDPEFVFLWMRFAGQNMAVFSRLAEGGSDFLRESV